MGCQVPVFRGWSVLNKKSLSFKAIAADYTMVVNKIYTLLIIKTLQIFGLLKWSLIRNINTTPALAIYPCCMLHVCKCSAFPNTSFLSFNAQNELTPPPSPSPPQAAPKIHNAWSLMNTLYQYTTPPWGKHQSSHQYGYVIRSCSCYMIQCSIFGVYSN